MIALYPVKQFTSLTPPPPKITDFYKDIQDREEDYSTVVETMAIDDNWCQ